MKYRITHLKESHPNIGTVYESLHDPKNRISIVDGTLSVYVDSGVIVIENIQKEIIFSGHINNITIEKIPES